MHGQSDTNGELAKLSLVEQSKIADHIKAPRASPTVDKKNAHLLTLDEYPEAIHAERAAEESEGRYQIPHIVPDIMVEWARKLVVNQPNNFYQWIHSHHHMS